MQSVPVAGRRIAGRQALRSSLAGPPQVRASVLHREFQRQRPILVLLGQLLLELAMGLLPMAVRFAGEAVFVSPELHRLVLHRDFG